MSAIATADPWIGKGLASGSWDGTVKVNFELGGGYFCCCCYFSSLELVVTI